MKRGLFWQRSARHGMLFTNGFKPRLATYNGFEVPVPLEIRIQHGEGDLVQVARDILGLTKLNYNACQHGEGQPITVKYSDRVGEILLAIQDWSLLNGGTISSSTPDGAPVTIKLGSCGDSPS